MTDLPPFTVLDVRTLTDGRVAVLVRKTGGRLLRVTVAAVAANGVDIDRLLRRVVADWPPIPAPATKEDFDGSNI